MAEERHRSWLERYFWPVALLAVVLVVVVVVVVLKAVNRSDQKEVDELNKNYVEKIEIRSNSVGNRSMPLVVIDGKARYDCSAENGKLSCSDDPQPTPQR